MSEPAPMPQHIDIPASKCTAESPDHYVVEASDLGWPPGKSRRYASTDIGDGTELVFQKVIEVAGEISGWMYLQGPTEIYVTVLND